MGFRSIEAFYQEADVQEGQEAFTLFGYISETDENFTNKVLAPSNTLKTCANYGEKEVMCRTILIELFLPLITSHLWRGAKRYLL